VCISDLYSTFFHAKNTYAPFPRERRPDIDVERPENQTNRLLSGEVLGIGSTASIIRVGNWIVLKSPHYTRSQSSKETLEEIKKCFKVEEEIFQILGTHPRIIPYGSTVLLLSPGLPLRVRTDFGSMLK
jgi:hypothetical protein